MKGQQKLNRKDYKVLISNLTDNENRVQIFRGTPQNKFTIRFQDIIEILQDNYPQYDPDKQMCIMCYSEDRSMWQYLTKNYYRRFDPQLQEDLNIRFQVILFTEDDDMLMYAYQSADQIKEIYDQNQQKTLTIQKEITSNIQKLSDLLQNTQKYQDEITRAITYEPLDIHIFWASPYYTDDSHERKKLSKYRQSSSVDHNCGLKKLDSLKKNLNQSFNLSHQKNQRKNSNRNNMTLQPPSLFQTQSHDHSPIPERLNHIYSHHQIHNKSFSYPKKIQSSQTQFNKSFNKIDQTVLRSTLKYPMYIETIIKTMRQGHKYAQIFIDNFNFSTFKHHNKRKFSVVYLICHTEVAETDNQSCENSEQITPPDFGHKKKSKNSTESITIKQERKQDENDIQQVIQNTSTIQQNSLKGKNYPHHSSKKSKIEQFEKSLKRAESIPIKEQQFSIPIKEQQFSIPMKQEQLADSIQIKIQAPSPILPDIPHLNANDTQYSFNAQISSFLKVLPSYKQESQQAKNQSSQLKNEQSGGNQSKIFNKQQEKLSLKVKSPINSKENSSEQISLELKKGVTEDVIDSLQKRYNKSYTTNSDQAKARRQSAVKSKNNKKEKPKKYYFVGQDVHGKMVHITPESLQQMLRSKSIEIQLLLLHTSFPFQHTQIFKKHAKNIILINSNPILPDESVNFFLEKYFSFLMFYKSISKAYKETMAQIKIKYPGFQCCCYHEHIIQCNSNKNFKPSKYDSYHYMYHYNRCFCPRKEFLLHYCPDKQTLAIRDYKILTKNDRKPLEQFFFCCCKTEKDLVHHHSKKFDAIQLKQDDLQCEILDIADGKLQQKGKYLDSFCKQSQLIGNHQVIINLLKCFISWIGVAQNKVTIFNIYGLPKTGKKYIARYFANLFIRKMKGQFTGYIQRQFQSIRDINVTKTQENVFYIFVHRPKGRNKQNLVIDRKGDNYIIPKNLNAILITDKQIQTQMGPMYESSETQPFQHKQQCPSYIKLNSHFSQQMKDKLKEYLNLTLRQQFKYYPRTFQKDQIVLALKKSRYDDKYKIFLEQCIEIPIVDLIFVAGACSALQFKMNFNQHQKRRDKHKNSNILFEIQRIRSKSKQHRLILSEKSFINFESLAYYYPLIFQYKLYKQKIARYAIDIMTIYAKRTMCNDDMCRFYEATTVNPKSYISWYFKPEIRRIKTEEILIRSQNSQKWIHPCVWNFSKSVFQNRKILFESGLEFLQNALMTHTIFSYLNDNEKEILIRYGIIFVNNLIIQQKNKAYYKKAYEDKELELISSISMQIPLDQSLSIQEDDQAHLVNLESMNLTSRKGIIYLLDRMMTHIPYSKQQSKNHLKIICQQLKIQLYFQSKYESEKLHENFNQQIEKTIFKIVKRHQNNLIYNNKNAQLTAILQYDCAVCLTLLYTNCGRQPMTKYAENMIVRAKRDGNLASNICRQTSKTDGNDGQVQRESIKAKLMMRICGDKNLFNRIISAQSPLWDSQGTFTQLIIYEDILVKWEMLSKCDPQNNPLQAHHILVQINRQIRSKIRGDSDSQQFKSQQLINDQRSVMKEKSSEKQGKKLYKFQSHYLDCLFFDLQKKFHQEFNKLNKKLFVWMEANPIPNKKNQALLQSRYLIKNTLIEQFNKQSQTKRKMLSKKQKLNRANLKQLQDTKGCRFLCLDLNLNINNETEILGESQDSELQKISHDQLAYFLCNIPVINLFICCQKPIKLIQKLKEQSGYNYLKKDIVYFDFKFLQTEQIKIPKLDSPLKSNKIQNKKTQNQYFIEKMIMMAFVKQIINRMHFHRQNLVDAFEKTVQTLEFIDQSDKVIFTTPQIRKVAFFHCYGQNYQNNLALLERQSTQQQLHNQAKKRVRISFADVFEAKQLQKVQIITKACFPQIPQNLTAKKQSSFIKSNSKKMQQQMQAIKALSSKSSDSKLIEIQFSIERLVSALIEYLKLKKNFHNHLVLDLQSCYKGNSNHGLFTKIKEAKILDLYYTAKKGILIFLNTQLIAQKGQKWQKQEFDKLFTFPQNMECVKSHKVRIKAGKNKKVANEVLICFFDRIESNYNEKE